MSRCSVRRRCRFVLLVLASSSCLPLGAAASDAAEFVIGSHRLTVPEGMTVELAAGPPLVDRPITMAFGDAGELYVAESSGSNDPVEKQLAEKPHRVLRLVDKDGDGKYDERTVFADKLMFPAGTMWLNGSLYVSAPPEIWKLTDTDGDGVADQREVWFDGGTLTGCANDLHGPFAGIDGFVYWTKGAFAQQTHRLDDGRRFVSRAAHLYRMRPDGSGLEPVVTAGMDNPVDIVFAPDGEPFLSGTLVVEQARGQRDGVFHAVYGGVWGRRQQFLNDIPRTGDLMPVMTLTGHAATSGMEISRLRGWGPEWGGNLLVAQFNFRKVTRHIVAPDGATFRTTDSDLLVSDQVDFHPTDVIEDETGSGSVLIADTGGWYKLCCPTSQLAKPEVLGGVYRVRKTGAEPASPMLKLAAKADGSHWIEHLDIGTAASRERAARALLSVGEPAAPALSAAVSDRSRPLGQRLACVWVLTRMPGEAARKAARAALGSDEPRVRNAAALGASLLRDAGATDALISLLSDPDAHVRRSAAEALGRIGDARAVAPLLAVDTRSGGRMLEHSVAYALYEIGDDAALAGATGGAGAIARGMIQKQRGATPEPPMRPIPIEPPAPGPDAAQLAQQRQRLEQLTAIVAKGGDPQRGKALFTDARIACATCHAVAGEGGTFGPDLTSVNAIRTQRDLVEAIAFPSASFVRSFEPVFVKTANASTLGVLRYEAPEEVVLGVAPNVDVKFPRKDVLALQRAATSVMPAGYDGTLTPEQLADLIAYLRQPR